MCEKTCRNLASHEKTRVGSYDGVVTVKNLLYLDHTLSTRRAMILQKIPISDEFYNALMVSISITERYLRLLHHFPMEHVENSLCLGIRWYRQRKGLFRTPSRMMARCCEETKCFTDCPAVKRMPACLITIRHTRVLEWTHVLLLFVTFMLTTEYLLHIFSTGILIVSVLKKHCSS